MVKDLTNQVCDSMMVAGSKDQNTYHHYNGESDTIQYEEEREIQMKIIISPAKKMEECQDMFEPGGYSVFLAQTKTLHRILRSMTEPELKKLFKANDQITRENLARYQSMDLDRAMTPALLSYIGIQYQYMAPKLFSFEQWEYVKKHLRILSGFYGILKPDDRVTPYRLEMQARLSVDGKKDLYDFWGDSLLRQIICEEKEQAGDEPAQPVILNLASKEYSKAVESCLTSDIRYVTCVFGIPDGGKIRTKATEAKMARGEMVRFMAENQIEDIERIRDFCGLGYCYSEEYSDKNHFIFLKDKNKAGKEEE